MGHIRIEETSHHDTSAPGRCRHHPLWLAIALSPLLSAGALAQEAPRQAALEEVVVTATRRAESAQLAPTSVTAISANELANKGIDNFEEITRIAAGVQLDAGHGSTSATVRIRGVGSQPFSGTDPSVGVLVDGVYLPSPGFAFTELMDIERIEVLRGPQGTLFGKNTTAGVIAIYTQEPSTTEVSGKVQAKVGNLNTRELRGTVNLPLVEDRLALRLSAFTAERDGYRHNRLVGEETFDGERQGGRVKALWQVTDNFKAVWSSEYTETESRNDQGLVNYGTLDSRQAGPLNNAPLEQAAAALGKPLPALSRHSGDVWQAPSRTEDKVERHLLTLTADLPGHVFTSLTAWEETENDYPQDSDGSLLDLSNTHSSPIRESWSQEFQLASASEGRIDYIVGAFFQNEKIDSNTLARDGVDLARLEGRAVRPTTTILSLRDDDTIAGFGNLTYHISDALSVTGGARYTRVERFSEQFIGSFPVIDGSEETFSEWTYSAKVRYQIDPDRMVYFAYDRGFKAGGFNRQNTGCFIPGGAATCLSQDQLAYDSETTDSFELGWKSEWLDRQVRFNGALFYQVYDDFHVSTTIPEGHSIIIRNAAEVESYGIEFDLIALPTDRLSIDLHAAWVETRFDSFASAPCSAVVSKLPSCVQDLSGKRLDNAPEWTVNIGAEYRQPLGVGASLEWFARADVSYRSATNLLPTLDPDTREDSYTLVGMRAGLEPANGPWRVTVWGNNLADEEYHTQAFRPAAHQDGLRLVEGLPRTYGMTLDWQF